MSFDELAGSPKESLNESSGSTVERKFLIPFSERLTFAQNLAGTGYPHFPQVRMVSIDIQPWNEEMRSSGTITDPSFDTADYGANPCLITVKYGADFTQKVWPTALPKPPHRAGTELRYQIRGTGSFLTIPASDCRWEDDGDSSDEEQSIVKQDVYNALVVPLTNLQFQWDFVDDPPTFAGLLGRVNDDVFFGAAPETILFDGFDISESFRASPLNPHTNRVNISLIARQIPDETMPGNFFGWNHEYREEPAGWAKIILSDGSSRYKSATFTGMFL